jgi:hypothetical protein
MLNNYRGRNQGKGVILLYMIDNSHPHSVKTRQETMTKPGWEVVNSLHTGQFQTPVTSECLVCSRQHHEQQKYSFLPKQYKKWCSTKTNALMSRETIMKSNLHRFETKCFCSY